MNTIRELKQQEKYKSMLKRKNKEKKIYKDKNASLQLEKQRLYIALRNKDKEIERLNNIIKRLEEFIEKEIELYTVELTEENKNKLSIVAPIKGVYKEIYNVLKELKGSDSNE